MRTYVLLLSLLGILASARAQVAAPEFICTRSEAGDEVLTWNNVANDCGDYQATEIYRAPTADGPYTLLTTLTDPTETEYRDPNPNGEQLFYYLRYAYDCPDSTVLSSDTLDSFIPATPDLNFVSVEDGDLVVNWQPSTSPEVNRYVVYEVTPTGTEVLDTVGNVRSYLIPDVPADEQTTRQFRVAALDPCGNDSPQSAIRRAVSLASINGQDCEPTIDIGPSVADMSNPDSIDIGSIITPRDTVLLYVSTDGENFSLYSRQPVSGLILASYPDVIDLEEVCFYIEIDFADLEVNQRTTILCVTPDIIQPVRDFPLFGVEIQDDGQLRFAYDPTVQQPAVYTTELEVIRLGGNERTTIDRLPAGGEVLVPDTFSVQPGDSLRFQLSTDTCQYTAASNSVTPVFLSVDGGGTSPAELAWTPLTNGLPGSIAYTVYREGPAGGLTPVAMGLAATAYTDVDNQDSTACYRVAAVYTPPAADTSYTFLSNRGCAIPRVEVYLPNVFSPVATQDANREFRPFFNTTLGVTDYLIRVYDRWGALVFESENPDEGWDGTVGGQALPVGSYMYTISFTPSQGNNRELHGVVHLVR